MYVDLAGNAKPYYKLAQPGIRIIGTMCNDEGCDPGALLLSEVTGKYHQGNHGQLRDIDQDEVLVAIAAARMRLLQGAPIIMDTRKSVYTVTLDAATADTLKRLGSGNLSLGIRRAAAMPQKL